MHSEAPTALLDLPIPHPPQALVGLLGSGKSSLLRERYAALLKKGVPAEKILAWVPHFAASGLWREAVAGFDFVHGETHIFTFRAWVRRELLMNWPLLESSGALPGAAPVAEPLCIGLAAAQEVMRDIIAQLAGNYPALDKCFSQPPQRVIQVLDAYARMVEHGLDPKEVVGRLNAGHWLGPNSEELHAFVGEAIANYRAFCLKHRVLDHALQLELYSRHLLPQARYRAQLAKEVEFLLVDNIEETLPVAQEVIAGLLTSCRGVVLVRDQNGGLRDYLGGDPVGADCLIEACEKRSMTLPISPLVTIAQRLADSIRQGLEAAAPIPVLGAPVRVHSPYTLRVEMFKALGSRLTQLLQAGVPEHEIVVIAPLIDPLLAWHLRQLLASLGRPLRVLSGSNRVIDHRSVRILVTLARGARPAWSKPSLDDDVAEVLEALLQLHPLEAARLQKLVYVMGAWLAPDKLSWPKNLAGRREAYEAIYEWVSEMQTKDLPLDRLFELAFSRLYAPRRLRALAPDGDVANGPVASPYRWGQDQALEILQIEQLINNAKQYRQLAALIAVPEGEIPLRFLRSIYAGELAEKPLIPRGSLPSAVTLYTAAKYAEEGPQASHQLWVDASAPQWHKSDVREFMNPRVLSRHWSGGLYRDDDDQADQAEKLARTLETLVLKCTGQIEVFCSDYGSDGAELGGELAYLMGELAPELAALPLTPLETLHG
jgi:hypothetical protein